MVLYFIAAVRCMISDWESSVMVSTGAFDGRDRGSDCEGEDGIHDDGNHDRIHDGVHDRIHDGVNVLDALMHTTATSITDHHLQALASFTQLSHLDLTNCSHISSLAPLTPLTALRSLALSNCILLTDSQMSHLQTLTNLLELRLDGVKISEKGVSSPTSSQDRVILNRYLLWLH